MIKNGHIILSQSITKEAGLFVIDDQVEEVEWCPKRLYHKYIAEDYPRDPTHAMLEGLYGETLLLGSAAHGERQDDLPRKNDGSKRVSQIRIEKQMDRLYGFMYAHGVKLHEHNKQVRLIAKYRPHVWLTGEFDIFPTYIKGQPSIVDVKTTKDVFSDFFSIADRWVRTSCNHCWGNYDRIAKNQPLFYHHIARNFSELTLEQMIRFNEPQKAKYEWLYNQNEDFSDTNFYYFVAGIGKPEIDDQLRMYEYQYNNQREVLLDTLIQAAVGRIKEGLSTDFAAKPNKDICKSCALKNTCKDAVIE